MSKYVIQGNSSLRGEVPIQGAKNAAQKILPATLVFPGTYVLNNLPRIQDTAALKLHSPSGQLGQTSTEDFESKQRNRPGRRLKKSLPIWYTFSTMCQSRSLSQG